MHPACGHDPNCAALGDECPGFARVRTLHLPFHSRITLWIHAPGNTHNGIHLIPNYAAFYIGRLSLIFATGGR